VRKYCSIATVSELKEQARSEGERLIAAAKAEKSNGSESRQRMTFRPSWPYCRSGAEQIRVGNRRQRTVKLVNKWPHNLSEASYGYYQYASSALRKKAALKHASAAVVLDAWSAICPGSSGRFRTTPFAARYA